MQPAFIVEANVAAQRAAQLPFGFEYLATELLARRNPKRGGSPSLLAPTNVQRQDNKRHCHGRAKRGPQKPVGRWIQHNLVVHMVGAANPDWLRPENSRGECQQAEDERHERAQAALLRSSNVM